MISLRYLRYAATAFAQCGVLAALAAWRGRPVSLPMGMLGLLFGAALTSIVLVRLPGLRRVFRRDPLNEPWTDRPGAANMRAALFLASIASGALFAATVWALGFEAQMLPAWCAAVSGGLSAAYHATSRG